ncbi:hypothetical protein ACFL08_00615 [Patescibacteria group bacterium]
MKSDACSGDMSKKDALDIIKELTMNLFNSMEIAFGIVGKELSQAECDILEVELKDEMLRRAETAKDNFYKMEKVFELLSQYYAGANTDVNNALNAAAKCARDIGDTKLKLTEAISCTESVLLQVKALDPVLPKSIMSNDM